MGGTTVPPITVQFQRVEPLLIILALIHLSDTVRGLALASLVFDGLPLSFSESLSCGSIILLLSIIMRAVIKELWIDFHEKFHGIVYHAMDGSNCVSFVGYMREMRCSLTYSNVLSSFRRVGRT
jgi:hypothetical protein